MNLKRLRFLAAAVGGLFLSVNGVFAQGTAFTYQGRLNDGGTAANGYYDLAFSTFNTNSSGTPNAGPITNTAVAVSNGLFTTTLDFGGQPLGKPVWLEIAVRTNGRGEMVTLSPRQALLPTPYAMFANTASNLLGSLSATQLTGALPASQLSGTLPATVFSGTYTGAVTLNNIGNTFSGDGSGLTNVDGAITWQTPPGLYVTLAANKGYLLTNDQQMTLYLPSAPNVGDVIRVAGGGSGGWKAAQGSGQVVLCGLSDKGQASDAPELSWNCIASSADGVKLVAVPGGGHIYLSQSSGDSWYETGTTNTYWVSVASSTNGAKLVAAASIGGIYTNSGGSDWIQTSAPSTNWTAVASSADGVKLVATVGGISGTSAGRIYTSANSGSTWTVTTAPVTNWDSVASAYDGTKLVAAVYNGGIYVSGNSGSTWTQTTAPITSWEQVVCSSDGVKLAAVASGGYIYVSSNSGTSWTQTAAPLTTWTSLACSADGVRLFATTGTRGIWASLNSGTSWFQTGAPIATDWFAITCPANGSKFVAGGASDGIYRFQPFTTTGASGYVTGSLGSAIELQYIGNGQFIVLSSGGMITPN
jgi:hypothetical protein